MKKILKVCICGLMTVALIAGCSKKAEDSVKLGNYKGVEYTPMAVEVTEAQIDGQIQNLLTVNPLITEVDREAASGDIVNIDFVGMKDGVAFEGGTSAGFDLTLGSGSFIDGFEEGLIGAVTGQELSLNLTFPEAYGNADLAGQAVVFDVTVNAVKESVPAELTDDFIKENTESATVEEYMEVVKADLLEQAKTNAENKKKSDVFLKVIEDSKITITDATVDVYYNEQFAVYEKQAETAGIDMETMMSYYGMTLETFKEQLRAMSVEATKQNAVVAAIAEAENITVTEEDKDLLVVEFGYENKEIMMEQAGDQVINNYILTEKVVNFIVEQAVEV